MYKFEDILWQNINFIEDPKMFPNDLANIVPSKCTNGLVFLFEESSKLLCISLF